MATKEFAGNRVTPTKVKKEIMNDEENKKTKEEP